MAQPGGIQADGRDCARLREEGVEAVHRGQVADEQLGRQEQRAKKVQDGDYCERSFALFGSDEGGAPRSSAPASSYDQRPSGGGGSADEYSQSAEISDDDIPF